MRWYHIAHLALTMVLGITVVVCLVLLATGGARGAKAFF